MMKDMYLRIWREKSVDANPYYPSSEGLHHCVRAAQALMADASAIISIERLAGGHRGSIQNDAEIDLSVRLLPGCSAGAYLCRAKDICQRFDVKLRCMQKEE